MTTPMFNIPPPRLPEAWAAPEPDHPPLPPVARNHDDTRLALAIAETAIEALNRHAPRTAELLSAQVRRLRDSMNTRLFRTATL